MPNVTDMMLLCRLCSVKEDVNVPIFEESDVKDVLLKITSCLPVKVSADDNLPKKICDTCLVKLESLHRFCNETVATERRFLNWISQAEQLIAASEDDKAPIKKELIDFPLAGNDHHHDDCPNPGPVRNKVFQEPKAKEESTGEPSPKRRRTLDSDEPMPKEATTENDSCLMETKTEGEIDAEDVKVSGIQPGTSVLPDDDAPCSKATEEISVPPTNLITSCVIKNQSDKSKYASSHGLRDCVVVLGDLEHVEPKRYDFATKTLAELKVKSLCKLKCKKCDLDFIDAVCYINHQVTKHIKGDGKVAERPTFACKFCAEIFDDERQMKKHMSATHPFQCMRCCRVFLNIHQSLLHTKMHIVKDRVHGSKSGGESAQKKKVAKAKTVQGGQGNYGCQECESRFEDCYQLQRHCVLSHNKKPQKRYEPVNLFKCVLCYKYFTTTALLDEHKQTHVTAVRSVAEAIEGPEESPPKCEEIAKCEEMDAEDLVDHKKEEPDDNLPEPSKEIFDSENVDIICNDIEFDDKAPEQPQTHRVAIVPIVLSCRPPETSTFVNIPSPQLTRFLPILPLGCTGMTVPYVPTPNSPKQQQQQQSVAVDNPPEARLVPNVKKKPPAERVTRYVPILPADFRKGSRVPPPLSSLQNKSKPNEPKLLNSYLERPAENSFEFKWSEENNAPSTAASSAVIEVEASDEEAKVCEVKVEPDGCVGIDLTSTDDNLPSVIPKGDVIEIDSSSDETEQLKKASGLDETVCVICNRKLCVSDGNIVAICTWCNRVVNMVASPSTNDDQKPQSPTAQCNICKSIHNSGEVITINALRVCDACKSKISAMLLAVGDKKRNLCDKKAVKDNKNCFMKCGVCRSYKNNEQIRLVNSVILCNDCEPKIIDVAALASNKDRPGATEAESVLVQTRCVVCKNLRKVDDISLFGDKSTCGMCRSNIHKLTKFLYDRLQKSKGCPTCQKLKKGASLVGSTKYCSECVAHRLLKVCPICSQQFETERCPTCDKVIVEGKKAKKTAAGDSSDEEDKLIIDLEPEGAKPPIEIVEDAKPSTSSQNLPKIFLKPLDHLLEPKAKAPVGQESVTCGICSDKIGQENVTLYTGILACRRCKIKMENLDNKSDGSFTCFYCSMVFDAKSALAQHKNYVHLCHICGKYRENVSEHLKKIVKCQICQSIFCKKIPLGDHYRQKHDSRWCAVCDIVLRDDYEVLLHRTSVHNQK